MLGSLLHYSQTTHQHGEEKGKERHHYGGLVSLASTPHPMSRSVALQKSVSGGGVLSSYNSSLQFVNGTNHVHQSVQGAVVLVQRSREEGC